MAGDWDGVAARARLRLDGESPDGHEATLEYCVQPPRVWMSDASGNLLLRCLGWVVNHDDSTARIRLSDARGVRKWLRPRRSRTDVQAFFQRRNSRVSEFSGFDCLLDLEGVNADNTTVSLEIFSGGETSGPLIQDVKTLYLEHRAALGHERPYRGVMEPTPETRGRLDVAAGRRVEGWAQNLFERAPVTVALFINGEKVADQSADRYREDLVRMHLSEDGANAFAFTLARDLEPGDEVRVAIPGGEELVNSPMTVD